MTFHPLSTKIPEPDKFTYPFCYTPHPLCLLAADEVQRYISTSEVWREEINKGKMFGVLVVKDEAGQLGYLAAYSGLLAGRNDWTFFVPAVYDLLQPDGYFCQHEDEISQINHRVTELENDKERLSLMDEIESFRIVAEKTIGDYQLEIKKAKECRDERRRREPLFEADLCEMTRESQFMKAELRRIKKSLQEDVHLKEEKLKSFDDLINKLRAERKQKSDALQHWLFMQFNMLNARGESRDLCSIFAETANHIPPAGAGECCAPKMLQYAYLHGMKPLCMAEFWWGSSPKTEIRHHLHYYPACRGKCLPILGHMLQGLDVEDNPLEKSDDMPLEVVYDDEWLSVVCKPAGMLSVPGKGHRPSVLSLFKEMYPGAEGPMIVHRLDMSTSGLIIIAKTKEAHQNIQAQFKNHQVRKRYIAILDGLIEDDRDTISLPLRADYFDRPRQIVDNEQGKPAITEYQVLSRDGGFTRIALYPHTGRTHQLRVHCAHPAGLAIPIKGDELYGKKSDRLYLHAEEITFGHPITLKEIKIKKAAQF